MAADIRLIVFFIIWFPACFFWKLLHIPSWLISYIWWVPFGILTFCPVPIFMLSEDLMSGYKANLEEWYKKTQSEDDPSFDYKKYEAQKRFLNTIQLFWFLVFFALMLFVAIQGGKILHIPDLFKGYTNWEL